VIFRFRKIDLLSQLSAVESRVAGVLSAIRRTAHLDLNLDFPENLMIFNLDTQIAKAFVLMLFQMLEAVEIENEALRVALNLV
jgi:hypothetical protein